MNGADPFEKIDRSGAGTVRQVASEPAADQIGEERHGVTPLSV